MQKYPKGVLICDSMISPFKNWLFSLSEFVQNIVNFWLANRVVPLDASLVSWENYWSNWYFLALKLIEELLSLCDLLKDWSSERGTPITVANLTLSVAHTNTLNFTRDSSVCIDTVDKTRYCVVARMWRRDGNGKKNVLFILSVVVFQRVTQCVQVETNRFCTWQSIADKIYWLFARFGVVGIWWNNASCWILDPLFRWWDCARLNVQRLRIFLWMNKWMKGFRCGHNRRAMNEWLFSFAQIGFYCVRPSCVEGTRINNNNVDRDLSKEMKFIDIWHI